MHDVFVHGACVPDTPCFSFETLRDPIRERLLSMFGHKFCSLGDMISDERSFRLTTKIELVEVRELTESTDWFLLFIFYTQTEIQ